MIKKGLTLTLFLVLLITPCIFAANKVKKKAYPDIVFPLKGQAFPYITHTMVFGSTYPGSKLTINDEDVNVHKNGAFLGFIPVKTGRFSLTVKSESKEGVFEIEREIKIGKPVKSSKIDSQEIQNHFMLPSSKVVLPPGEEVIMRFMGTPGKKGFFHFKGEEDFFLLKEIEFKEYQGIYEGAFVFNEPFQKPKGIVFELFEGDKKIASKESPHTLWIKELFPSVVYEVQEDLVKARNQPGGGYKLLLHRGSRLASTGIIEPYIRLKLSEKEVVFVDKKDLLKCENAGAQKKAFVGNVQISKDNNAISFKAACSRSVPYLIKENIDHNSLSLFLYSASGNIDRIINKQYKDVSNITFQQVEQDVLQIDVTLPFKPIWGWSVEFTEGKIIWLIHEPPVINVEKPLQGIQICLDPGHSPGSGAVGPTRLLEKDINWIIADKLRKSLEKNGAEVIMTRDKRTDKASLRDRVKIARGKKSDLFISIHNNSVSNGKNPYDSSGTETYFYTPSSQTLAGYLHPLLLKATGLTDGGVRFGNFAVLRNPFTPCVLLEIAYIIIPEQEQLLKDETFQESLVLQIVTGIKKFLLKEAKVI